jgi:hypothetical protein
MRAPSLVLPALIAALGAQAVLAWRLYTTTHQSYDRGDAIAVFAFLPSVAIVLCALLLLRSLQQWRNHHSSLLQPLGSALPLFLTGALFGFGGLWLAFVGGPHGAGFFVFWSLLLQVLLFALARRSVRKWATGAYLGKSAS